MLPSLIKETFLKSAKAALSWEIQLDDEHSCMPSGHNGPYFHIEGPLRNTCHWLMVFLTAEKFAGGEQYVDIIQRLIRFLMSPQDYQTSLGYVHRQTGKMDWCNGVIGSAWMIETFARIKVSSYQNLLDEESTQKFISAHQFDAGVGCWHRLDPRKGRLTIDYTYDHQAWLAASLLDWHGESLNEVKCFLDVSHKSSFAVDSVGLIDHMYKAKTLKGFYNQFVYSRNKIKNVEKVKVKEVGYQLYVLFALARLFFKNKSHGLFVSEKFERALAYCDLEFFKSLTDNPFAYPYNAPGFALPYIYQAFSDVMPIQEDDVANVVQMQIQKTFSQKIGLFTENTKDPFTLAARLYELSFYLENTLSD